MTYNNSYVKTYEFTAFTEADLLQGVNGGSINCGDVFTMPASATTCFTVKDDDGALSGDAYRNESGDDRSYQTADIEVNGEPVMGGVKIYAEQYHVLHGSDGKTYYLIEIEVKNGDAPGEGDDFFTFYGDVPPSGVELTVASASNVKCDWVDYKCLDAGLKWELEDDCRYTIEAESLELSGYKSEWNDAASGDELIKLKRDVGYAKTDFGGEDGAYDLEICYVDENDGQGFIDIFVNGVFVDCISLNQDDNGNGVKNTTFSSFVIEGLELKQGDEIKLKGRGDDGEYARIDKLVFSQCDDEPEFRECDDPNAVKIDFNALAAGAVVLDQFDGVAISAAGGSGDAMIFDSANPTGGDTDLATANQGNVLIISEDGDQSDPDDNAGGGTLTFAFDNPSFIFDIKVIDTEEGGVITLFDADNGVIGTVDIPQIGDGETDQVLIDTDGVARMEVSLNGSGAVDDLCYVPGEDPNEDPDALNDAGKVCSDASVTIDVLANDSDPDGDALTVTGIVTDAGLDGAFGTADDVAATPILEGETVTLNSGATVTLSGGQLVYDVSGDGDDFDGLLIGETAADAFGYTIDDGNGGTATTGVDIELCGALNTLETIAASLPAQMGFTITDGLIADPNDPNGFSVTLSAPGDTRLDGLVIEDAYCLSFFDSLITDTALEGDVYLADADIIPAGSLNDLAKDNLDLINFILNQDFTSQDNGDGAGETYTDVEVQTAIWKLTDDILFLNGPGTIDNVNEIVDLAVANGEGFVAGEGDIIGLFLDPTDATETILGHSQPFIVGVPFNDLAEDCICA